MQTKLNAKQLLLLRISAANQASKRIADRIATQCTPQAITDAEAGDVKAAEWLDVVTPDWRDERLFNVLAKAGRKRQRS